MPLSAPAVQRDRQLLLRTLPDAERGLLTAMLGTLLLAQNQQMDTGA
jgi:hypothetical protein